MGERAQQIRNKVREMAKELGPKVTFLATVKSVDVDAQTCVLTDEVADVELDYPDVRLCPVLDGKESITIIPKVGTWALAVRIEDDNDWFLIACEEIESIKIKAGDITLFLNSDGIKLNGDSLGGLIKINELVSDINSIKTDINNLKAVFTAWVTVPQDGGAALKTALATWMSQILEQTLKSTLENTKVKHG